jgi:hypothetical protein
MMLKRIFSFFVLFLLMACTQAPQPFRHGRTGEDVSGLRLRDGGLVLILPMEGTPRPLGEILSRSLADSLAVRNIPSTSSMVKRPNYKVRGQVIINKKNAKSEPLGSIYWTFSNHQDQVVHESSQLIQASRNQWDYGDQAMVDQLVEDAADKFASYLQDASETGDIAESGQDDRVFFAITKITGAPGDGKDALIKAMSLTLKQSGALVTKKPSAKTYLLSSEIDLLAPYEGKQRIKISWIVQDPDGNELGRAQQDNQVPEGSLNGKWGRLAFDISRAAMNGIGEVVTRHQTEQRWERSRENEAKSAAPGRRKLSMPSPF